MILHPIIPPIHASMPHKQAPLHYSAMGIKHTPACLLPVHVTYDVSNFIATI